MLIGSWGRAPRPGRRAAVFGACIAFIVGQTAMPFAAHASTEDFDLLRLQLNSLVGARATFLEQLAAADGQIGALLSRDLLQASRPLVSAQSDLAAATVSRAARDPFALPAAQRPADRAAGPGLLLGAHVPSTSPPPVAPARTPDRLAQAAWRQAVLAAPTLTLALPAQNVGGVSSLSRASLGAAPGQPGMLLVPASSLGSAAPIAPASVGSDTAGPAQQAHYQALGSAQDLQPARSLQIAGRVVPLRSVAPQSAAVAPPAPTLPPPSDSVHAAARTDGVLPAYARATALLRGSLDSVSSPVSLTSQGLDPKERLTSLARLQASLGHYALSASPGTLSTAPASSVSRFPSAQVSWTFTASTPSSGGGPAALTGSGHANGTSIHDLQLTASPPLATQAAAAPGTSLALSLTPDGAGLLDATAVGSDGTSVRLQVRVEGLGSDPELQAALNKEQLALAQLSGVIPTGDALYTRLLPEYQQRLQIYNAQLVQVMGRNNAVEQAWWAKSTARRAYLVARDQWQARAAAWERHLHGGTSPLGVPSPIAPSSLAGSPTPGPSASPGIGSAGSATPIPALPSTVPTVQATPAPSALPAASPTPPGGSGGLFGQAGPGDLVVRPGARVAASISLAPVPPTPGQVPLFGSPAQPSPTQVPPTATDAATASPSLAVDTATATLTPAAVPSASAVIVPSASPGATAVASPGTAAPTGSPAPTAITTPVDGLPLAPPGPPPALVPSPGLEPELEALPPPVLPLPGWANAPVAVSVAPHLQSAMVATLNAAGWADISYDQLLADGAMDGVTGYIPPLRGVITTQWGGSTPWQSFHPGLDIATDQDTPVVAAADGYVIYAGLAVPGDPTSSYGNCVMIQHNAVISTLYGHMDMGDHGLQVVVGQQVRQGQTIGYEGATGWATGPHVHFEMRVNNTQFNPELLVSEQQILR